MSNGIILLPISDNIQKREQIYKKLSKTISLMYVGLKDIENVNGDDSLKSNIIIANLKNYIALSVPFIFFDCENKIPQQRKIILDYALKSKYSVVGLVLDIPNTLSIINKDSPELSEGFQNIYYYN
jgi:hypothetical protein